MPVPTLPLARGGIAQALYPFVASIQFDTGIHFNADGTEQRWKRNSPRFAFQFAYGSMPQGERDSFVTLFDSQKGAAGSNLQANLSNVPGIGAAISNLAFDDDVITWSRKKPMTYEFGFRLRQTQNRAFSIPSVTAQFPMLSAGVLTQLPYEGSYRNLTMFGDSPSGPRYSRPFWDGSISGLPTRPLRRFMLANPCLPDADVSTLVTFFLWTQGMLETYSYTDPDSGTTYPTCRNEGDMLEIHYEDVNHTQISWVVTESMN